jgi:hypothetical protein
MTFTRLAAAATSSVALALAAAPALVVTTQTAAAQTEDGFTADQLDAFVAAFLEVDEVRTDYTEQLQQAEDEAAQETLVAEGNAAIVDAIESVDGMDVELYSAIIEQAGSDADLNDRITSRLQEVTEG